MSCKCGSREHQCGPYVGDGEYVTYFDEKPVNFDGCLTGLSAYARSGAMHEILKPLIFTRWSTVKRGMTPPPLFHQ